MKPWRPIARQGSQVLALGLCCLMALQLTLVVRIASMAVCNPSSTTYQRSELWRQITEQHRVSWSQVWVDYERISAHLKRAVVASEDSRFAEHGGVEWDAIEKAWERNRRAQQHDASSPSNRTVRLRGGSTITQQLAKNLLLSGERTIWRKGQELLLSWMLETLLSKRRILELYLNHVEWADGVFGAQAAARHYFRVDASRLSAEQSARLAVMLPAPKRFERRPASDYVVARAATILARMPQVELP